jgi:alkylation response protein AidB-like acyl-CoA dehydrogenase
MLALARSHALDRVQFGRPLASFQAVRHRLAETLVALEGAEAALAAADDLAGGSAAGGLAGGSAGGSAGASAGVGDEELAALLAKAAAGQAALTAARHCQQVLGGIGFTAEHGLNRHVRRALVLDGLLGSARELTREAGARLVAERSARRVVDL